MTREYRLRIANPGAPVIDGNVGIAAVLAKAPVVTSHIIYPASGRTELRPFRAEAIDVAGALTAELTDAGRWDAIGRLADVQHSDDGGPFVTYGTGRVSQIDEGDGPGKYNVEISDESIITRKSVVFTEADTVHVWPASLRAPWRGFGVLGSATGEQVVTRSGNADLKRIELAFPSHAARVTEPLANYISELLVSDAVKLDDSISSTNNFGPLRLNYNGINYFILSFSRDPFSLSWTDSFIDTRATDPSPNEPVRIHVWVNSAVSIPEDQDGHLFLDDQPPSRNVPLHIGIADASHKWGTAEGWIHPATLVRRVWDETATRYDPGSVAALEADTSYPVLAPRVTAQADNPEDWLREHVYVTGMLPFAGTDGLRRLVDVRLPQDLDPGTLPILDASNAAAGTWSLTGREAVNSITWKYLSVTRPAGDVKREDAQLDGFIVEERATDPIEADTVATMGRRSLELSLLGALEPTADFNRRREAQAAGGASWDGTVEEITQERLDIYQDGAYRLRGEVGRTAADALEPGDLAILNLGSLQMPNPVSGARSDLRLVRLLSIERHPAHAVCEFLDLGPNAQPLAAPTVDIAWSASSPGRVTVTLSGIPAGATAELQVAYTGSAAEPSRWPLRRAGLANGVYTFTGVPAAGFAHARARSTAPHRIRSVWALDFVSIGDRPVILAAAITLDQSGIPTLSIAHSSATLGVRLEILIHDPAADPVFVTSEDHSVGEFPLLLAGVQVPGSRSISIRIEPWTGFSGGSVTGTAGTAVVTSTDRTAVSLPLSMAIDVDLSVADEAQLTVRVADPRPGRDVEISYTDDGTSVPGAGSITVNSTPTENQINGVAGPLTVSHTVNAGTDRVLLVSTQSTVSTPISGVTFNGSPLTLAVTASEFNRVAEIWYLVNPPVMTADVVVSYGNANTVMKAVGVVALNGVDQATPIGDTNSAAVSGTSGSVNITTTADNSFVADSIRIDGTLDQAMTAGPQQAMFEAATENCGGSLEVAGTAPDVVTMSWSWPASRDGALVAAEIIAAPGSGSGGVTPLSPQTLDGSFVTPDLDTTGFVVFTADTTDVSIIRFVAKAPSRIQASQTVTFGIQGPPGTPGVAGRLRFFGIGGVNTTDLTIEVQHDTGESGELFVWVNPSSLGSPDPTTAAADGSVLFASTPFVANNATIFNLTGGGTDDLLNNIPVTAQIPKQVFARAEFDDGTVAEGYYALPGVVTIVDPDGILAGNVVGSTNIQDDAIQTPHLSANSVVADTIGAREVTVEKMTIGSFANLIPDAGFESGDLADSEWTVVDDGGGTFLINFGFTKTGRFALQYTRAGQAANAVIEHASSGTACNPGDPFYHSAWFAGRGTGSGTSAGVILVFYNAAGTPIGSAADISPIPKDTYSLRAAEGVAPAGAVRVDFELVIFNDGTTEFIRIDDSYANRQTPGELVVDGAITAPKINVVKLDAIAADIGVLTAGRLNNAGNTAGVLLSGAFQSDWTQWLRLDATGSQRFLAHRNTPGGNDYNFYVRANGDVFVRGDFDGNIEVGNITYKIQTVATTGNIHNFSLSADVSSLSFTGDPGSAFLTGVTGGSDMRQLIIRNDSPTSSHTIAEQNTGSSAANRFDHRGAGNIFLASRGGMAYYIYANGRWRLMVDAAF